MVKKEFNIGDANINNNVVFSIALLSAKEALGIRENEEYGIKGCITSCNTSLVNNKVYVDLSIKLRSNFSVSDTSFDIQSLIKKSIESTTDCIVDKINISVEGVLFDKKHKKD